MEEVIDDNVNLTEKADDIVSGENSEAKEAKNVDIIDSDCDVYIFTYWDNEKKSKAQEAINYIEGKVKWGLVLDAQVLDSGWTVACSFKLHCFQTLGSWLCQNDL